MLRTNKIIIIILIIVVLFGWLLLRPSTDVVHPDDPRIGTTKTYDVSMVYITNCSQCSLSRRAQNIGKFLVPQTFLYDSTGFLDDDSKIVQTKEGEIFTIQEVFTNYPHGLERAFRSESAYFVAKDTQGIISVISTNVKDIIQFEKENRNISHQRRINTQLIDDIDGRGISWILVELYPILPGEFDRIALPDYAEERRKLVAKIEQEFLDKFPKDQILQYRLDPYHSRVYLQIDNKGPVFYLQAEQVGLNINFISLYNGIGDPLVPR